MQIAILEGQREIAKLLLNSGVDPNGKFQFNEQYLNLAIDSSQPEIAENLIRKGAKVNLKGPFGLTVLRNAVVNEMEGIVRLLLKHGARISDSEENKKIMSLLTFSVAKNNVGIVRLLLILIRIQIELYNPLPSGQSMNAFVIGFKGCQSVAQLILDGIQAVEDPVVERLFPEFSP